MSKISNAFGYIILISGTKDYLCPTPLSVGMRGSRNFRQGGGGGGGVGGGGGGGGSRSVKWSISKKSIIFQGSRGGPTFSRGGGPTFSRGGPIVYSL